MTARTAIASLMSRQIESLTSRWALAAGTLDAFSPLATLQRGYAIVTDERGAVVADASTVKVGERIHARLGNGSLEARIELVEPAQDPDKQ